MKIKKEFKRLPISALRPYENNPRINDIAVADVIESMKQTGNIDPIEIDENGVILSGHTRLKALQAQGITETEVLIVSGLTEKQKKKYRILANKAAERALWDAAKLEVELDGLDFEGYDFGFDSIGENEWFSRSEKDGARRQEGNEEYNEFLDKFEPKKTTDDCYTPENIYEAIVGWVEKEYGLKRSTFIRPFYPGGDYQKENYKGKIVVDNPPFSILSEIVEFYVARKIPFFLFAPGLTFIGYTSKGDVCAVCAGMQITYENGADVQTSFLSSMEDPDIVARTAPDLNRILNEINKENQRKLAKEMPKYDFPVEVLTSAKMNYMSKYGQEIRIRRKDAVLIRNLDAMKESGKEGIYGAALLLSEKAAAEKAAAEKAAAEKAAAEKWELSEREKEIVRSLGKE